MDTKNLDFLQKQTTYLGFGDSFHEKIKEKLQAGQPKFDLAHKGNFNGKETEYTLHFAKGTTSDYYFLNSYDAKMGDHQINISIRSVKVENGNGEKLNPNITAKESFNILDGRSVYKARINKENQQYNAWFSLDPSAKNAAGFTELKSIHDNYGYDMAKELANVKGTEFQLALPEKQAEVALKKGNLVEMHNADKSEKYFIATDPYYKTMMVFDSEGKKQYVHNTKKVSNAVTGSLPEKQEVKQAVKSNVEEEKKKCRLKCRALFAEWIEKLTRWRWSPFFILLSWAFPGACPDRAFRCNPRL